MPVIPIVGRRSFSVRLLIAALHLILTLGAVTMIYPFALMVSTAMTSEADWQEFKLIPRYWFSTGALFRKYLVDKTDMPTLAFDYRRDDWHAVSDIQSKHFDTLRSTPPEILARIDADYAEFMKTLDPQFKHLDFVRVSEASKLSQRAAYFTWLAKKYDHNLDRVNGLYDDTAEDWNEFGLPRSYAGRWEPEPQRPRHRDWREFVSSRSYRKQRLLTLDSIAFQELRRRFGSVEALNKQHGTSFANLFEVTWTALTDTNWGRDLQDTLLRSAVPLDQITLRDTAREPFETFSKNETPFTARVPIDHDQRNVWIRFVRSKQCTLEDIDFIDPKTLWQDFLKSKYTDLKSLNTAHGAAYASFDRIRLPAERVDWVEFSTHEKQIFRDYLLGNFAMVIDFILIHGRALINTLILIVCTIGTALTINPMAAYVLSRFRLRYAHHILIFLLATMAFPAEVVMIPGFLLVKSFPLGAIVLGAAALLMFFAIRALIRIHLPVIWSVTLAAAVAGLAGWYLPPVVAQLLGREDLNVTLMNTYFALILPGIASGYSIFLLKGFFDSLPPELYEAAMLDGAGEIRMFAVITMPLCKPVLAVIALGAFTAAYGMFMFAFLTCQDPKMWTLMVFLYQFQQTYGVPQVMASLVITAIPTLLVFIFCQNIILRGIVIPTFK